MKPATASCGASLTKRYTITMPMTIPSKAFPAPGHNHELCLDAAMARARAAFAAKGRRLTPLREAVFQVIAAASHRAIGAYEVLDRMARRGERLAPISVYRAIDALVAAGIVHRFESRNAFFACHAGHDERQLVLACEQCGSVAEVDVRRCSSPSTASPRAPRSPRARRRAPSWRSGACAPIARARTATMQGREGLDWPLRPSGGTLLRDRRESSDPDRAIDAHDHA